MGHKMTPDDGSITRLLLDWSGAIAAAFAGLLWKANAAALDTVRADHQRQLDQNRQDLSTLFKKLDDHSARSEQRHIEMMSALHSGLSAKADR
jgi:Skp family chaperone for outer membrane proteins